MASTQALSAAAQDRKTRLAQLKSLKRKQPSEDIAPLDDLTNEPSAKSPRHETPLSQEADVTTRYLSGRNYDLETKNAKLGFENNPSAAAGSKTLEQQAAELAAETQRQAAAEEQADKPLDLFALQPKKANWDLKRDLERKLEVLNVRTDNAIARLVRERIAAQQRAKNGVAGESEGTDAGGLEGATLVEATNVREREDEEEAKRERLEEDALLDAS